MTVRKGASLEASTAPEASTASAAAGAIVAALARAGTRLMFGVPGGGPNLEHGRGGGGGGVALRPGARRDRGDDHGRYQRGSHRSARGGGGHPGTGAGQRGQRDRARGARPAARGGDRGNTVPAANAGRISHQRIDQAALGRSVAKAAVTMAGPPAAAGAVAIALAAPPGPVIANMDDGAADQDGSPRVEERSREIQTLRAAEARAARAGRALLAEAVTGARRPVVLLGTGAIPSTAAVREALDGRGIPALHTYRARGVLPDSGGEAAGLVTGGTMEWPLLSAADLIVGLGVDEAEMIPARWDYAARTILVSEPGAAPQAGGSPARAC